MADKLAKEIIAEFNREKQKQSNIRNLWQKTGDALYPYVQVTSTFTPGTQRTYNMYSITPMLDAKKMVAGFKQVLMPPGQIFFEIKVNSRFANNERVQRYLSILTELSHEYLFASNFPVKVDDVLRSWIIFGPGCMFQGFDSKIGLNYKYSKVGSYVIFEDEYENPIGSTHRFKMCAIDAYQKYGNRAGVDVIKSASEISTFYDEYWYLYKTMPRKINPRISTDYNLNMPYGAWIVNEKEETTVEIGGFYENKYAIGRWERPEYEKDGRGIGTEILPQIEILFDMTDNFIECGNKWVNPPKQALVDQVEGLIRTGPRGITWVNQIDAVRAMDSAMNGNYPYTEKTLQWMIDIIHDAFYRNAFDPLENLTGDRRTTLEIQERIRGTLKHLGPPAGRIWKEFFNPILTSSILDLIRNRKVPQPPPELKGVNFGIEYVGPLALTMKSEQTRGFQEWAGVVSELSAKFPYSHLEDNIDFDDAIPRMGRTFGVNAEDISTFEERQAKRAARQQAMEQQKAMALAQIASKGYKETSKAAEEGSAAQQIMEQIG